MRWWFTLGIIHTNVVWVRKCSWLGSPVVNCNRWAKFSMMRPHWNTSLVCNFTLIGLLKERPYLVLALNLIFSQISSFTHIYGFVDFNGTDLWIYRIWQIFRFNYRFEDFERPPCPQGSIVLFICWITFSSTMFNVL